MTCEKDPAPAGDRSHGEVPTPVEEIDWHGCTSNPRAHIWVYSDFSQNHDDDIQLSVVFLPTLTSMLPPASYVAVLKNPAAGRARRSTRLMRSPTQQRGGMSLLGSSKLG